MKRKLIGYCGLDCEKCDARAATVSNDNVLREKTAKLWSELNGVVIPAEAINCMGCRTDGIKTPYCDSMCPVRKCAAEKKYDTCGECSKLFSCELMKPIAVGSPQTMENLKD